MPLGAVGLNRSSSRASSTRDHRDRNGYRTSYDSGMSMYGSGGGGHTGYDYGHGYAHGSNSTLGSAAALGLGGLDGGLGLGLSLNHSLPNTPSATSSTTTDRRRTRRLDVLLERDDEDTCAGVVGIASDRDRWTRAPRRRSSLRSNHSGRSVGSDCSRKSLRRRRSKGKSTGYSAYSVGSEVTRQNGAKAAAGVVRRATTLRKVRRVDGWDWIRPTDLDGWDNRADRRCNRTRLDSEAGR